MERGGCKGIKRDRNEKEADKELGRGERRKTVLEARVHKGL